MIITTYPKHPATINPDLVFFLGAGAQHCMNNATTADFWQQQKTDLVCCVDSADTYSINNDNLATGFRIAGMGCLVEHYPRGTHFVINIAKAPDTDALQLAMGLTAFDAKVSLIFTGDGIKNLLPGFEHLHQQYAALAHFDIEQALVAQFSLEQYDIDATTLSLACDAFDTLPDIGDVQTVY